MAQRDLLHPALAVLERPLRRGDPLELSILGVTGAVRCRAVPLAHTPAGRLWFAPLDTTKSLPDRGVATLVYRGMPGGGEFFASGAWVREGHEDSNGRPAANSGTASVTYRMDIEDLGHTRGIRLPTRAAPVVPMTWS